MTKFQIKKILHEKYIVYMLYNQGRIKGKIFEDSDIFRDKGTLTSKKTEKKRSYILGI